MLTPSDPDYRETRQILLGKKEIRPEFRPLADWIRQTYGVQPLNIFYDTIDNGQRPRLDIHFEYPHEKVSFDEAGSINFDKEKQQAIAQKFKEVIGAQGLSRGKELKGLLKNPLEKYYKTDNVWVIYSDFASIAKTEANESVTKEQLERLKEALDEPDLWEISRLFSGTTFFLYTEEQVRKYRDSPKHQRWSEQYHELLTAHDIFGYFKKDSFKVYLDSKENFEQNYEGNWWFYYK